MNKLITNDSELQLALSKIDHLTDRYSKGDKTVKDEMIELSNFIEDYEEKTWKLFSI